MRLTAACALLFCSIQLHAESWYGFCVIEKDQKRICSEPELRQGDFSPVCDKFAIGEGASFWRARFATSLEYLRASMPNYCDQVRTVQPGIAYACQLANLCPGSESAAIEHLASRVYAPNSEKAVESCLSQESPTYTRKLKEYSNRGCFVKIAVETLTN